MTLNPRELRIQQGRWTSNSNHPTFTHYADDEGILSLRYPVSMGAAAVMGRPPGLVCNPRAVLCSSCQMGQKVWEAHPPLKRLLLEVVETPLPILWTCHVATSSFREFGEGARKEEETDCGYPPTTCPNPPQLVTGREAALWVDFSPGESLPFKKCLLSLGPCLR